MTPGLSIANFRRIVIAAIVCNTLSTPLSAQEDKAFDVLLGSRVVYRSDAKLLDPPPLTVDVFWCSGSSDAAGRAAAASELAASYATILRLTPSNKLNVAEIRTRPIEKDTFIGNLAAGEEQIVREKPLIRFDDNDQNAKRFAAEVVSKGIMPVGLVSPTQMAYTPNYLSIFVCTNVDVSRLSGRLFVQVKDVGQRNSAQRLIDDLRRSLPGVSVAADVEVVGSKSPKTSEIRYFYSGDAALADRIAAELSTSIKGVIAKQVSGYENKVRRGTFEAWISD